MAEITLPTHKTFRNLTGERFTRLSVISFAGMLGLSGRRRACWNCVCDCGTSVIVPQNELVTSNKKSCGCLNREIQSSGKVTHGMKHILEYGAWTKMKARCFNSNSTGFENYGGRGITVCERWLSFPAFIADMGRRPTPYHSIDRIDVNGNYEPGNCRWATRKQQATNQRRNRRIAFHGETRCLSEWCELFSIPYHVVLGRIDKQGWDFERALTTPPRKMTRRHHV